MSEGDIHTTNNAREKLSRQILLRFVYSKYFHCRERFLLFFGLRPCNAPCDMKQRRFLWGKMNESRKKVFCLASTLVRNKNKVYSKRALVSARLLGGTKHTQCRIFLLFCWWKINRNHFETSKQSTGGRKSLKKSVWGFFVARWFPTKQIVCKEKTVCRVDQGGNFVVLGDLANLGE